MYIKSLIYITKTLHQNDSYKIYGYIYKCLNLPRCRRKERSAMWSGNYIVFNKELGGQLVRQDLTVYFVQFCFVLVLQCYSCVHYTNETMKVLFTVSVSTTAVLDLLIRRVSTPNKILYVLLREKVTFYTLLQGY